LASPPETSAKLTGRAVRLLRGLLVLAVLCGGVGWLAGSLWLDIIANQPGPHDSNQIILIEPGDGNVRISWVLARAGVVHHRLHYRALSLRRQSNFVPKVGEYNIPPRASLAEIMAILQAGKSLQRRLTVPEGWQVRQIVETLNQAEGLTGQIVNLPAEGSLFPDTFFYQRGMERRQLIERMQAAAETELALAWAGRAAGLPLSSAEELRILASMIEAETGRREERALVASVFFNRLRRGMRLQSDPTVLYGLQGRAPMDRQISKQDLQSRHGWNTYLIEGLPKTPIGNPGRAALQAAANPAATDYLYFVADGMGGHLFAKTLDAHNRNVRLYRQRINQ
jgi:UPF0755 protein